SVSREYHVRDSNEGGGGTISRPQRSSHHFTGRPKKQHMSPTKRNRIGRRLKRVGSSSINSKVPALIKPKNPYVASRNPWKPPKVMPIVTPATPRSVRVSMPH